MTTADQFDTQKFLIYQNENHEVLADVLIKDETLWMTQKMMAELFEVDVSTINEHLKNIYNSQELLEKATIGKFPIVQKEGNREVTRYINFYNLL